jgi:hypothetical protein
MSVFIDTHYRITDCLTVPVRIVTEEEHKLCSWRSPRNENKGVWGRVTVAATRYVYFDQPTFCIMWHQGKLWPYNDNATERRAVKTGCLLPRCLPAGGYKEQIHHVRIRDSSHCFLSEEEWFVNLWNCNVQLYAGRTECWAAGVQQFCFQYVTCIQVYNTLKLYVNLCSRCIL